MARRQRSNLRTCVLVVVTFMAVQDIVQRGQGEREPAVPHVRSMTTTDRYSSRLLPREPEMQWILSADPQQAN